MAQISGSVDEGYSAPNPLNELLAKYGFTPPVSSGGVLDMQTAYNNRSQKAGDWAGLQADPEFAQYKNAVTHQVMPGSQEFSQLIDEDGPGNGAGKGSMKEGILTTIAAIAAMYGAGQIASSFGAPIGADTTAFESAASTVPAGGATPLGADTMAFEAGASGVPVAGEAGITDASLGELGINTALPTNIGGSTVADTIAGPSITQVGTQAAGSGATTGASTVANATNGVNGAQSWLDKYIPDWMKTKTGGLIAGQMASGLLQGAGAGIGAVNAQKVKAASDKALIQQQADTQLAQSRAGTYTGGATVAPRSGTVLRYLSNGQPVYVRAGLIGTGA